ncbi:Os02g0734400, partial [Oryza sativa Japonica Group]
TPCNTQYPLWHARVRARLICWSRVSLICLLDRYVFHYEFAIDPRKGSPAAAAAVGAATELQKHVAFFDSNHDGIISFSETYEGFRALGFGVVTSRFSATVINGALGTKTRPENATASRFSIYIENIHKGVHGSDTGAFDSEGRFVNEKFDEIFTKHAKTVPDGLTAAELDEMLRANREPKDYKGWVGASTEWETTFKLGKDKDGFLRKDTVRTVYDGSFFSKVASKKKGPSANQA